MNVYAIPGLPNKKREDIIFKEACRIFGEEPEHVMALRKKRDRPYATIRQLTMTAIKLRMPEKSWQSVSDFFLQHHATAMHAFKTIKNLRDTDKKFKEMTDPLFDGVKF